MGDRIRELRKALGLNQTDFGKRLGIKQTTVAGYETGAKKPMDAVITSICREFNVNEVWIRTGNGTIFTENPQNMLMSWAGLVLAENNSFRKRFLLALSRLDNNDWVTLEKISDYLIQFSD